MSYLAEPIQKKKRSLLDSEQSEFALASDQVPVTNAQKHVARNVKEVRQSHYVTKKRCRVAKNTGNDLDNKPELCLLLRKRPYAFGDGDSFRCFASCAFRSDGS